MHDCLSYGNPRDPSSQPISFPDWPDRGAPSGGSRIAVRFWPEADDRELAAHESVRHCARVGLL